MVADGGVTTRRMANWTPNPSYWTGSIPRERHRITTSPTEVAHLVIAFLVLTIDLTLIWEYLWLGVIPGGFRAGAAAQAVAFAVTAAFTGFIAHEMAHKVAAQRYGFWAEFRMSPVGLLLSLVTAFAGVLFAAPGATVVSGMGDVREWGRTSLAGPLLNLVEGTAFLAAGAAVWFDSHARFVAAELLLLALFNGWFAAFNLIPFGPLDGRKVLRWSRLGWAVSFAVSLGFTVGVLALWAEGIPPF